jgi:4-diphosphocytidyl-2-C-methyl-D-erythritol kinase
VLLKKPLPLEKLLELAAELGSDVPFFLLGGTAVGLSRGTELYPLPDPPARPGLLITPGIHVSTAQAYAQLGRTLASAPPPPTIASFQSAAWQIAAASPVATFCGVNDFETVVFRMHPQLKLVKGKLLKLGARPALMSGSGSALFGIFSSRQLRDRAVESLRKDFARDTVHSVTMISRDRYRALWRRQLAAPLDSKTWPPLDRYAR